MTRDEDFQDDEALRRFVDHELSNDELAGDAAAREWREFLDDCRSAAQLDQVELERDASRVIDAVLAQTIGEDLGWRGDLRLVGGFVSRRLRSSALLRVAAASLLVHLIALPVLAVYRVWKAEPAKHELWVEFESLPDLPYDLATETDVEDTELSTADAGALPVLDELDAASLEVQNARNADRWTIFERSEGLRLVAEREWDSPLERRLASRARHLLDGSTTDSLPELEDPTLERLLRLDERLDALLLGGPLDLQADELAWLVDLAAGDPPRAAVALAVLERAQRYGLPLGAEGHALLGRLQTPELERFSGLSTAAGRAPLSSEWVRTVRSAAQAGTVSPDFETLLRR